VNRLNIYERSFTILRCCAQTAVVFCIRNLHVNSFARLACVLMANGPTGRCTLTYGSHSSARSNGLSRDNRHLHRQADNNRRSELGN